MFVNGEMIDGAQPASQFRALFDSALKEAGVSAPTTPPTPAADSSTTSPADRAADFPNRQSQGIRLHCRRF
jgi:hypothetical protein